MGSQKDYLSSSVQDFVRDVAAKTPTPGGGSVAALAGALAGALAQMALAFSVERKETADHKADLQKWLDEFKETTEGLNQLIHEDMAAYEALIAARKSGDAAKQKRVLLRTISVPMEIIALTGAITARLDEAKGWVNPRLTPDLQGAAELASAAARIAASSVRANFGILTDDKYAQRLENQLDLLLARLTRHRNSIVHYQRT